MEVKYVGPSDSVDVAGQTCKRGATITVSATVGQSLAQQGVWESVSKTAPKQQEDES